MTLPTALPRDRSGALRRAATLLLLCCALLARLAVPGGWMPVAGAAGTYLVPCAGLATGPVAHPGMPREHRQPEQHRSDEHPCAFAGAALALAEPLTPAFVPVPSAPAVARAVVGATAAVGRGLAAPPPPATGPPILA